MPVVAARVGHKGADHLVPGNTPASFDAALDVGVDMIEFDVLSDHPDGTGELFLAHDYRVLRAGARPTLEQGLQHLSDPAFAHVDLDVDLKLAGYEDRVIDALRRHGLDRRALISTMELDSLRAVRALAPDLRLGWSVPKLRSDPTKSRLTRYPAYGALATYRALLPRRAAAAIRAGRIDALMAQFRLVTPALVRAVHGAGGQLYAWTVDDRAHIDRLEALGVDGIISNDPRLFRPGFGPPRTSGRPAAGASCRARPR